MMKSLSVSSIGALVFACALFTACNEEEEVVPQMTTTKPAVTEKASAPAPAPAPAADEPQLVPIQSLNQNASSEPAPEAKNEPQAAAAAAPAPTGDVAPLAEGQYVIQISIQPSKKAADGIVKKLAEQNIKA